MIFAPLLRPEAPTRMSTRPNFATAAATIASQSSSLRGRCATISVLPPSASHSAATFFNSSARLAARTVFAPAPASRLAADIEQRERVLEEFVGHGVVLFSLPSLGREVGLLRRCRDCDQHGHHIVGAIDHLAHLVRADEAAVVRLQHRLLAAGNDGELAGEDEVDLLGRRGIRAGAAAGEEMRESDHELLGAAGLGAEQAHRGVGAVVRHLVRLGVGKALDLHQNVSPFSMRYEPLGSVIATRRMMQPSPRSQFHGKNAKVQRLPVTLSISPPTFSMPKMPFLNRIRCTGSHSGKSSFQSRPPDHFLYSSARCGCSGPLRCGPIAVASGWSLAWVSWPTTLTFFSTNHSPADGTKPGERQK